MHWLLADPSNVTGPQVARATRQLRLALIQHLLVYDGASPTLALPIRENVLQITAILVPLLLAVSDS